MIQRREFITLLGGAAAWPLAARAQQGDRMRRIGVLMGYDENEPVAKAWVSAFIQALAGTAAATCGSTLGGAAMTSIGYERSRRSWSVCNPTSSWHRGTAVTAALQRETRTIPVVFANVADPVVSGIVPRLNQPGGNITGFANLEGSMGGKWLELLSEIAPGLQRAAIMFNPDTAPASAYMPSLETAARSLKIVPIVAPVHNDAEIETAITALGREPGGGLVVFGAFAVAHRAPIISAAARSNLPAVYNLSAYTRDGGLLSYGVDQVDTYRRAATYVDRILRGAKPTELPVQLPIKFEMVVNRKTATALALAITPIDSAARG
jgi:putative ABC transport system substrate-binding protein